MTITVAWVTDTGTLQPAIEQAAGHLNAHLVIVSELGAMPTDAVDLLIWTPLRLDRPRYEQLRQTCSYMVICIPKGMVIPRWYPRYDPRWPSYWAITPFDTDEFVVLLECTIRGPQLAPFEAEPGDSAGL